MGTIVLVSIELRTALRAARRSPAARREGVRARHEERQGPEERPSSLLPDGEDNRRGRRSRGGDTAANARKARSSFGTSSHDGRSLATLGNERTSEREMAGRRRARRASPSQDGVPIRSGSRELPCRRWRTGSAQVGGAAALRPESRSVASGGRWLAAAGLQLSSFFFRSSWTICGLALPLVAFITWPTNQPITLGFLR